VVWAYVVVWPYGPILESARGWGWLQCLPAPALTMHFMAFTMLCSVAAQFAERDWFKVNRILCLMESTCVGTKAADRRPSAP